MTAIIVSQRPVGAKAIVTCKVVYRVHEQELSQTTETEAILVIRMKMHT